MDAPETHVSLSVAARHCGRSHDYLRQLCRAGVLPAVRVPYGMRHSWQVRLSDVDAYLLRAARLTPAQARELGTRALLRKSRSASPLTAALESVNANP